MYHIEGVKKIISNDVLETEYQKAEKELQQENIDFLKNWDDTKKSISCRVLFFILCVEREIKVETSTESLSHLRIPKIALPKYNDWGDLIKWKGQENLPGSFPYTGRYLSFKRTGKTLPECLPEKADLKEPTEDSIMFLQKCLQNVCLQLLIP